LGDRISQLEEGISNILNSISTRGVTNESTSPSQLEFPIYQESEELVEIARTLASNASSVAASEGTQSTPSTVRAFNSALSPEDTRAISRRGNSGITEHTTTIDSEQEASCSMIGAPLTAQRRSRIDSWAQKIGPPDLFSSDTSSIPDITWITFTETPKFPDALNTPPSTIYSQEVNDIEIQLIKRRYDRAKYLMERQRYQEAIPHLKRTLDSIKATREKPCFQEARPYQTVQQLLAAALINTSSNLTEAETILQDLLESPECESLERYSAAHLLAQLYFDQHPDDCTKAKTLCLKAVKGRDATLGSTHPETYASIALLCSICRASSDSDEEVWREMLPEGFGWHDMGCKVSLVYTLTGHREGVGAIAFSSDGKLVASGSMDRDARLWDIATGALLQRVLGHSEAVFTVAFWPGGKQVASGSADWRVSFWDVTPIKLGPQGYSHMHGLDATTITYLPCANNATGKARASKKKVPASAMPVASRLNNGETRLYNAAWKTQASGNKTSAAAMAFSSDGKLAATGGGSFLGSNKFRESKSPGSRSFGILNPEGVEKRSTLAGAGRATSFTSSLDCMQISVGKTLVVWDPFTGRTLNILTGHFSTITSVTFSPDCNLIASGSEDKIIIVWDAATAATRYILLGHLGTVTAVTFSPDCGLIASGSEDKTIKLWEVATGTVHRTLNGHMAAVTAVTFSPDGRLVVSGSEDKTIKLWDVATGTVRCTLEGHSSTVAAVAFSSDGKMIASGSMDRTIKLWTLCP
jgi:WD40 repeat protein